MSRFILSEWALSHRLLVWYLMLVSLAADMISDIQLEFPQGVVGPFLMIVSVMYTWRRSRVPAITVKANTMGSVQPATIVAQLEAAINEFSDGLPRSVNLALGGAVEDSAEAQEPIVSAMPLMLLFMATIVMIQLQSFQRLFLVFAITPFAIIGVVLALLPSGIPVGFVIIPGILALIGILNRNSVILIVQIEDLRTAGTNPWHAVVEATEHRMRPILLTAAAASLALIPVSRDVFWGPMAYAMMGGIIVGTILTLLFLNALYVAWFRIPQADVTVR